jgi:hypothetical protein
VGRQELPEAAMGNLKDLDRGGAVVNLISPMRRGRKSCGQVVVVRKAHSWKEATETERIWESRYHFKLTLNSRGTSRSFQAA